MSAALSLLLHIRYREEGAPDRYEPVLLAPEFFDDLCKRLAESDAVREVRVYEQRFRAHKTFVEDMDPARLEATVTALLRAQASEQSGG